MRKVSHRCPEPWFGAEHRADGRCAQWRRGRRIGSAGAARLQGPIQAEEGHCLARWLRRGRIGWKDLCGGHFMDESIILVTASVVGAVVNFGLLVVVWRQLLLNSEQVRIMRESYIADHERRKKQSTIEYVNSIREKYRPIVGRLEEKFGINHVINLSEIDENERRNIRELLSIIEHMAVGVETEVYDIDIVDRMSGSYFLRMRRILDPYISVSQSRSPNNYVEFDRMCDRIRAKRKIPNNVGKLTLPAEAHRVPA
ncbi:hypothetical protein [Azospirillum argentinense]